MQCAIEICDASLLGEGVRVGFFFGGGGYNTIQQTLEWIEVVCRCESRQIPPTALDFFFFFLYSLGKKTINGTLFLI